MPVPVAFPNEVLNALAGVSTKIADNSQPDPVVGELLQDFTGHPVPEVEKSRGEVLFVEDDLVKSLVIEVPQQVEAILAVLNEDLVGDQFGYLGVADGVSGDLHVGDTVVDDVMMP